MADEKKQIKREVSAGGVVYKKEDNQIFVLLILTSGKALENPNIKWTFPKGLIEENKSESLKETALREVKEETGVNAKIKADLGEVEFSFYWKGQKIVKTVNWFLMEYESGDTEDHDFEVKEAAWFTIPEADLKLTYKTDKEIFEKAKEIIAQ